MNNITNYTGFYIIIIVIPYYDHYYNYFLQPHSSFLIHFVISF